MQFKLFELKNINLVVYNNEKSKFEFIKEILKHDLKIIYIDIDLVISGYIISNVLKPNADLELLIIEDLSKLEKVLAELFMNIDDNIIILDSLDTLSMLYNDHFSSICISFILSNLKNSRSRLIIMSRSTKRFLDKVIENIIYIDKI